MVVTLAIIGTYRVVAVAFVIGGSAMAIQASPCCCSIHCPTVATQSQWLVVVLEGTGVSGGHNNNKDLQNGGDKLSSPCHSGGGVVNTVVVNSTGHVYW